VGGGQHVEDLQADPHPRGLVRPARDDFLQALAVDELEHEEVTLLALEVVVDLADVGMVQLREHARFPEEARSPLRVQPSLVDDLEGDPPLELLVEPDVDGAHPAPGQEIDDAYVPDALAEEVLVSHRHGGRILAGACPATRPGSALIYLTGLSGGSDAGASTTAFHAPSACFCQTTT
jgi:hypothetical protein